MASATRATACEPPLERPRSAERARSQPTPRPATRPITVLPPIARTSVSAARRSVSAPAATRPTVTRMVTNGRASPSLRPLSTLRALRMTSGTRGFATTAWPRAASVGARITPTRPACQGSRPRRRAATTAPATIVSGSPIPSSRPDRLGSFVQRRMLRLDASAKRTMTSAASRSRTSSSSSAAISTSPSTGPAMNPAAAKKIGAVTTVDASRFEIRAYPSTARAMNASGAIIPSFLLRDGRRWTPSRPRQAGVSTLIPGSTAATRQSPE